MTQKPETTLAVISELAPLLGGKIQRVDVVADQELVLEIRCPGRTFRLLLSARPGLGRAHLIPERPAKTAPGGAFQALLRKRLVGRALVHLSALGRTVVVGGEDVGLEVHLDRGKAAFHFLPSEALPAPMPSAVSPDYGALTFPENEAAAGRYVARAPQDAERALRAMLTRRVVADEKKGQRLLANLDKDRTALLASAEAGHAGELLKGVLHTVVRGAKSVRVTDWTSGQELELALDPSIPPKENLERFFRRAKRATRGLPQVETRRDRLLLRLQALAEERARLEHATFEQLLESAEALAEQEKHSETAAQRAARGNPLDAYSRAFVAADGSEIRVGKGAKQNDRLTFGGARADDLWLHARGTPGAHVILRNAKGKSAHPDALLDAAHLAVHYSSQKDERKAEVIWTEARYVKKTKGAPAGQVGVSKARTLVLEVEPQRLDRLLGRRPS